MCLVLWGSWPLCTERVYIHIYLQTPSPHPTHISLRAIVISKILEDSHLPGRLCGAPGGRDGRGGRRERGVGGRGLRSKHESKELKPVFFLVHTMKYNIIGEENTNMLIIFLYKCINIEIRVVSIWRVCYYWRTFDYFSEWEGKYEIEIGWNWVSKLSPAWRPGSDQYVDLLIISPRSARPSPAQFLPCHPIRTIYQKPA